MSELRDLTAALRAKSARLTAIEECLTEVIRNTTQTADSIKHRQMEEFMGALWKYLAELDERLTALANVRHDDVRALSERVRRLEPQEEVTKT